MSGIFQTNHAESGARPPKRQRTASSSSSTEKENKAESSPLKKAHIRHSSLFLSTGDIVILTNAVSFRVHINTLLEWCPKLLKFPIPIGSPSSPAIIGLPWDAELVEQSLIIIYGQHSQLTEVLSKSSFERLSRLFLFAVEHGIRAVITKILHLFRQSFPTTLDEHDLRFARNQSHRATDVDSHSAVTADAVPARCIIRLLEGARVSYSDLAPALSYAWSKTVLDDPLVYDGLQMHVAARLTAGLDRLRYDIPDDLALIRRRLRDGMIKLRMQGHDSDPCRAWLSRIWDCQVSAIDRRSIIESLGQKINEIDLFPNRPPCHPECHTNVITALTAYREKVWRSLGPKFAEPTKKLAEGSSTAN